MRIGAWASRHRAAVAAAATVAVGLALFVVLWFQPQRLFLDKTVSEALPAASPSTGSAPATPSAPVVLRSGSFRSLEHRTTGRAQLVRLADGSVIARIEDLDTSNGPVLRVYLSTVPPDRGLHDYGDGYVDLGALKGNRGDQNYSVPRGTDLAKFRSLVIWCRRFRVGFGVAPLR